MIVGLIEGEMASLAPRLDVYGFPQTGSTVPFGVRQAGPPNSSGRPLVSLLLGLTIPTNPVFLNQHIYAQAMSTPADVGIISRLSNGLRLTIGGIVP